MPKKRSKKKIVKKKAIKKTPLKKLITLRKLIAKAIPKKTRLKKKKKKSARISRQTVVLFFLGLTCLLLFSVYKIHKAKVLSFTTVPQTVSHQKGENIPQAVNIPKLSLKLSIEESRIHNGVWEISESGASHLTASAYPGEKGNIVIYGHNLNHIFGPLHNLKTGDDIYIRTKSGKIHPYTVKNILVVGPNAVEILESHGKEVLTLYTCTGFADLHRLVIQAVPRTPLSL